MDLDRYLGTIHQHLAVAAQHASEPVAQAASQLSSGIEPALRLALLELTADVAADVTVQLDGDSVEVRLRGRDPELVVLRAPRPADTSPDGPPPPPEPPAAPEPDDGGTARVSLRLPESLKTQVERAASAAGVSTNTWLVRAAQAALTDSPTPPGGQWNRSGRHLSGWAR